MKNVENCALGFAVAVTADLRRLAVLFDYEFAEEHVENDDDGADRDPEESWEAWKAKQSATVLQLQLLSLTSQVATAVLVEEYHMMFVGRRFHDFFDVDRVSQVVDMLLVGCYVENRCQRFRQLHGEDLLLGAELDGRVDAPSVACIVASVRSIQSNLQLCLVVVANPHSYVDVRHVAVVQPSECEVSMQELRVDVELEVLIAEPETSE
jgi:hypothetical protein